MNTWKLGLGACGILFSVLIAREAAAATCTSVTLTPSPGGTQTLGGPVSLNTSSTGCANPQYAFYAQEPGGTWVTLQGYGAGDYSWTSGPSIGTYTLEVWVKDTSSSNTYDTYTDVSYTLTAPSSPTCTSVTLTPSPATTQAVGQTVMLNSTSTACLNPEYAFYAQEPGGNWVQLRDYGSDASYSWTSGPSAGVYELEVWVKDASSGNEFDTYTDLSYTLTAGAPPVTPCTGVTLAPSPANTQTVGSLVSLTASSAGCPNPLYEFYDEQPDGTWTLLQSYSDGGYAWTSGPSIGTYDLEVWARDETLPLNSIPTPM